MRYNALFESPLGPLTILASEKGITQVAWGDSRDKMDHITMGNIALSYVDLAREQLDDYFKGKRKHFDVPLDVDGSAFQIRVWQALKAIPYGKTVSYSDIARDVDKPDAVRAVGTANAKNPVAIVVPCHRVIKKDGQTGQYAGGSAVKVSLLQLEQEVSCI